MKTLSIIVIAITLSSFSLCRSNMNVYGTYKGKDIHRGECLSNLVIKKDNSFEFRQMLLAKEESVSGNWILKSDTLFLNYNSGDKKVCLPSVLKVSEETDNISLTNFQKDKTACSECTSFVKLKGN